MSNEQVYPDIKRDIESCYGVLNGNILSVAAKIVDSATSQPISGLTVNKVFNSGNHVPVGTIKVFNDVYDETTGFYWFDVKVNLLEEAVTFGFETLATVNGKKFPISFSVSVPGQTKAEVGKLYFNGSTVQYEVTGKSGTRILRYPLDTITHTNVSSVRHPTRLLSEGVNYLWNANLGAGDAREIRILGNVMIDDEVHTYVVRQTVKVPNVLKSAVKQLTGNQVNIMLTLDTPVGDDVKMMGVGGYLKTPELGKTLISADNLTVTNGTELSFDVTLWDIKHKGEVYFDMTFNLGDECNTPLPVKLQSEVKRFSNGQTEAVLTEMAQVVANDLHTLIYKVDWKNGEPVEGFTVIPDEEETDVKIKGNHFFLTKPVKIDPDRAQEFSLSGKVSLAEYGLTDSITYKGTKTVGSDLFPLKVPGSICSFIEDKAAFIVALRSNNGNVLDNVVVDSVVIEQGPLGTTIRSTDYDGDSGQLRFQVDASLSDLIYPSVNVIVKVNLTVSHGQEQGQHQIKIASKVKVDYKIHPTYIGTRFEKGPNGYKGIAQWKILDNNDGAPKSTSIISFKVNGKNTTFTKRYNQTTRILSAEFDIPVESGEIVHITGTISASELNHFVSLSDAMFTFYTPGAATLLKHLFDPEMTRLTVQWKMAGWSTEIPGEVLLDDWLVLGGVTTEFLFTDYNPHTGILTCAFKLTDPKSDRFSARTTCRIGKSDGNGYPISFTVLP